jgi:hypothetical protein
MQEILLIQPRTAEKGQSGLFTTLHPHLILIYRVMQEAAQKFNIIAVLSNTV